MMGPGCSSNSTPASQNSSNTNSNNNIQNNQTGQEPTGINTAELPPPTESEPPVAPGACCLPTGCSVLTTAECEAGGGISVGGVCSASTCHGDITPPPSANFCEENPQEGFCNDGDFEDECEEDPEACEEEEESACCFDADGWCELLPPAICQEEDGTVHQQLMCSEACPTYDTHEAIQEGACCVPSEGCLFAESILCNELGGSLTPNAECEDACPDLQEYPSIACCFAEEDETFCEDLPASICRFEEGQVVDGMSCSADPCGN